MRASLIWGSSKPIFVLVFTLLFIPFIFYIVGEVYMLSISKLIFIIDYICDGVQHSHTVSRDAGGMVSTSAPIFSFHATNVRSSSFVSGTLLIELPTVVEFNTHISTDEPQTHCYPVNQVTRTCVILGDSIVILLTWTKTFCGIQSLYLLKLRTITECLVRGGMSHINTAPS